MTPTAGRARILDEVPASTLDWLLDDANPAVATLTRLTLMAEPEDDAARALWARRNSYPPVAAILEAQRDDGSWDTPARDYAKYRGSHWQVHFLGELHADGSDERVRRGAEYEFTRQMPDGSFSAGNMTAAASIPCLTANVGRALARLGFAEDPRAVAALDYCAKLYRETGVLDCRGGQEYQLNGYCHMLTPKLLLFLAEVPRRLWPDGAEALRDAAIAKLREKRVHLCLPVESREFTDRIWSLPASKRHGVRESFLAEHPELHYKAKPGWLRFGHPLAYNSDVLEALDALRAAGEPPRAEYADAIRVVRASADPAMRWTLRNTLNGKMIADVEVKGEPSRWLTLRALRVLEWASQAASPPG